MRQRLSGRLVLIVQPVVLLAIAGGWWALSPAAEDDARRLITGKTAVLDVEIPRTEPLRIAPLYDDPTVVSDEDLVAVLEKVRPLFQKNRLSPNHVEHALRAWSIEAEFQDPRAMPGELMVDFLVDTAKHFASWGNAGKPLLIENTEDEGVIVNWGDEPGESVHHDHTLACLTEAGVRLDHPVATNRRTNLEGILRQAMRDFRIDERETEWSAMSFALWLPPQKSWRTGDGRRVTFDMIARRLMRASCHDGVCLGTHRVYSLMVLWRLNEDFGILSDTVRDEVWEHLHWVKRQITQSQLPDGRWPTNWGDGKDAVDHPIKDVEYRQVIATGHHLEWLAIAPPELHPPREQVRKAARWLINNVKTTPQAEIRRKYTFYSHVGNALALWRKTTPAKAWTTWRKANPLRQSLTAPRP